MHRPLAQENWLGGQVRAGGQGGQVQMFISRPLFSPIVLCVPPPTRSILFEMLCSSVQNHTGA